MITSPTLLIDEYKCRANIAQMAQKARDHGLEFKPHFKTHQSADIGEWFRDEGITSITVSSVKMARYFAENGWEDITIAFPVNIRELNAINALAKQVKLTLLVSESTVLETLSEELEATVNALIEIDTGSNRTGFKTDKFGDIDQLIEGFQKQEFLNFAGFYSHPGHSYASRSPKEIKHVHADVIRQCTELKERYHSPGMNISICIGDTPCCSVADDFTSIDQISPGNFAFYDLMQTHIGSCSLDDIAVVLACPIVAKYPSRNEIIIHGGAIHLSKERLQSDTKTHFGIPVSLDENGWSQPVENSFVKSISQEHGIIICNSEDLSSFNCGDLIGIFPVHSCLTADLMMGYQSLSGRTLNHIRKPELQAYG